MAVWVMFMYPVVTLDRLTAVLTGGKHTHCELLFEDGMCYGSWRGHKIEPVHASHEWYTECEWDYVRLKISREQEAALRKYCERHIGDEYSTVAAVASAVPCVRLPADYRTFYNTHRKRAYPSRFRSKHLWYCSEFVLAGLQQECGAAPFLQCRLVTPTQMFRALTAPGAPPAAGHRVEPRDKVAAKLHATWHV
jgi:hypothetical protein